MHPRVALPLALSIWVLGPMAAAQPRPAADTLKDFDAWAEKTRVAFQVPGFAVSVVQDGKVILSKGYGLRDVEAGLPMTSKTLFAIGSISKSFNVAVMGTLVDEGKLDWDHPVRDFLPQFRLFDPVATDQVTLRDLVTHRTGLPRHDAVWYTSDFEKPELVSRLRYLEPSQPLRSRFQYNNLMFMTAGYLEEQILHDSWENIVRDRILTPLRMDGTNFSVLDSQKAPDFARGYRKDRKTQKVAPVPFYVQHGVGPAGEINSSVEDMSHYLLFYLEKGKYGGKQVVSEGNIGQMTATQIAMPGDNSYKELGASAYGMGLVVTTYRGHKLVWHNGGIDGFYAQFAFLPDDRIGVTVLNNLESVLPDAVTYNILDRLLGLDQVAWTERFLDEEKKGNVAEESAENGGFTGRKTGTHPSHELADYTGDFVNPGYGRVSISKGEPGGDRPLTITLNRMTRPLSHFHYDTFSTPPDPLDPLEKTVVSFQTDLKGDISSVSIPLEPNVKAIEFVRVAEKRMSERSFLEPFLGKYDVAGTILTVAMEGDSTLTIGGPGAPPRRLVPRHGTLFDINGRPGQSVEFRPGEMVWYGPGSASVFKRQ